MPIEIDIPSTYAGKRLDSVLAKLLESTEEFRPPTGETIPSRSRLQQWIRDGHVTIDGSTTRPAFKLKGGERLKLDIPKPEPLEVEPEAMELDILYEDAELICVNKPQGLVVHPGAGHFNGTLVHGLLHHCRDLAGIGGVLRPGIVHRLDRGTSGAIVVAKTDRAHEGLTAQFAERKVQKRYLALVFGTPNPSRGVIETFYGRHPTDRKKFSSKVTSGKKALTSYSVVVSRFGISQVDILLGTGRTHQIRVHLADAGYPIVGDGVYSGRQYSRIKDEAVGQLAMTLNYQALHALELGFTHPVSGEQLSLRAPMPEPLTSLVDLLSEGADG